MQTFHARAAVTGGHQTADYVAFGLTIATVETIFFHFSSTHKFVYRLSKRPLYFAFTESRPSRHANSYRGQRLVADCDAASGFSP